MNNYGTAGKALAHTGAIAVLGMSASWTIAAAGTLVVLGAVFIRMAFRRRRPIGQR